MKIIAVRMDTNKYQQKRTSRLLQTINVFFLIFIYLQTCTSILTGTSNAIEYLKLFHRKQRKIATKTKCQG